MGELVPDAGHDLGGELCEGSIAVGIDQGNDQGKQDVGVTRKKPGSKRHPLSLSEICECSACVSRGNTWCFKERLDQTCSYLNLKGIFNMEHKTYHLFGFLSKPMLEK